MRLSSTQEWIVVGVLILYIAFTPGLPVIRQLLSSGVGKAAGLALVVYVWKSVSQPVALLLAISFLRCAGFREGLENPSATLKPNCPTGYTLNESSNMCEKAGEAPIAGKVCMPPNSKWDGSKCVAEGPSSGTMPQNDLASMSSQTGSVPPPPSVLSPTGPTGPAKEPFTGGFQPNMEGGELFAPA